MFIIQNSRKTSTEFGASTASTLRMSLPFMSKIKQNKKVSGTEIGHSLEFDLRRPTSAQLSRAVKVDEINMVVLNHCVLLDNPKIIEG